MTDKTKEDEKGTDDKGTDEPDDESKSATIADVKRIVKEVAEDIKSAVTGGGDDKPGDDDDTDDSGKDDDKDRKGPSGDRISLRAIQRTAFEATRKAIKEAKLEEQHDEDHKKMREPKPPVENNAPAKQNRLRNFMLGKGYVEQENK